MNIKLTDRILRLKEENQALEKQLAVYQNIIDNEIFPLTKFMSEEAKLDKTNTCGKIAPLVAIKYMKSLEKDGELIKKAVREQTKHLSDNQLKKIWGEEVYKLINN